MQIKYEMEGECWRYVGPYRVDGYPVINLDGKRQILRRVLYENLIDSIPYGKLIGNTCGNRWCIRIEHLRIKTGKTVKRSRPFTHCIYGHELTAENTYEHKGQACKQCRKDQYKKRKAKKLNE